MKNFIAIVITVIIVAACAYGIYKQIDDFNKQYEEDYAFINYSLDKRII